MDAKKRILVLHDDDCIGRAVVQKLETDHVPIRELRQQAPFHEVVGSAFGCRAIIAVGDRFVADSAVLSAANMPGVGTLILVVRQATEFSALRKRGIPYTVLRAAPLLEDFVTALEPIVASGRLMLEANDDVQVSFVAADDVAACAVAAVDTDDYCGRIIDLVAPDEMKLSELASRIAEAQLRTLKVSMWPRWVLVAMRALGRTPFRLPEALQRSITREDLSALHRGAWRSVEDVAPSVPERREDHALGVQ